MLVHSTVETVLAYLNCHTLYLSGGFIFVGRLLICLFTCTWQLIVTGYYYYHCLSDNQQWLCTKVEEAGSSHKTGLLAGMDNSFRHSMYVYILYLRCKDVILAILCMGLPNSLPLFLTTNS